jgi:hypothetical protein
LPADLETRFAQFSNRKLLEKGNSQAMLAQLRRSNLPAIRRVVELIDRYNAGLEQEALLVKFQFVIAGQIDERGLLMMITWTHDSQYDCMASIV